MTDRWRAGCIERCKSGSEGGVGRRIRWITRPAPTLLARRRDTGTERAKDFRSSRPDIESRQRARARADQLTIWPINSLQPKRRTSRQHGPEAGDDTRAKLTREQPGARACFRSTTINPSPLGHHHIMTKRKAKERAKKETQRRPRRMEKKPEPERAPAMLASEAGLKCFCGLPAEFFDGTYYVCTAHCTNPQAVRLATSRAQVVRAS